MEISYLKLTIAALLPALLSLVLYRLNKRPALQKTSYAARQILYGVLFGALAVLGTEWGIPMAGAQVNCRDAAVLCAGLFFGAPAGILAGVIGGVERWIAVAWGVGAFTRTACSISTLLAGFYAAFLRRYLFDGKRPNFLISFAVGVVMEVFHLTMIFITNMAEPEAAMAVVRYCTIPMVIANGVAVMLSSLVLYGAGRGQQREKKGNNLRISQIVQRGLLITVLIAFVLTSFFVVRLQNTLATVQTNRVLERANNEVIADLKDASDENLLSLALQAAEDLKTMDLRAIAEKYDVAEINKVNQDGIIVETIQLAYMGFDMHSGAQSAEFLCLLDGAETYVQDYGPIAYASNISRKYAGVKLEDGFLQIGYDADEFHRDLDQRIQEITMNRCVGETGYVLILDAKNKLVSASGAFQPAFEEDFTSQNWKQIGETFSLTVDGVLCYGHHRNAESYHILTVLPEPEANQLRTIAIYVNTFLEILVFALVFGQVYLMIRSVVVNHIKSFNRSLAKISAGELDEAVNVRANAEFSALSDDINSTVDTLKRYISEASARINQELEAATAIQFSALPSVKPNFSSRSDLDIQATMDPAKEVGGDFYDFYMTDASHFHFLIADVSGKGIPAAMFMMRAKTELRNKTESGAALDDVFFHGNQDLCQGNDAEMFVTAWQGCLDLRTGDVKYVNAGHNQPLVRRGSGAFEMLEARPNFVLGGMDGVRYQLQQIHLERGDTLFLYTDGVTEATNAQNELYGNDRLLRIANERIYETMDEMCRAVKEDLERFVGEAPQFDDITMLAVRYIGTQPDWKITFEEAKLADIPALTQSVEEELEKMGCPVKIITQMSVAIDEIYSNIVKFAYPGRAGYASLTIHEEAQPHAVSLIFEDAGVPYNPLTNAEPDITLSAEERGIGGLGILIVKKSMDEVQYRYENDRNIFTIKKKL